VSYHDLFIGLLTIDVRFHSRLISQQTIEHHSMVNRTGNGHQLSFGLDHAQDQVSSHTTSVNHSNSTLNQSQQSTTLLLSKSMTSQSASALDRSNLRQQAPPMKVHKQICDIVQTRLHSECFFFLACFSSRHVNRVNNRYIVMHRYVRFVKLKVVQEIRRNQNVVPTIINCRQTSNRLVSLFVSFFLVMFCQHVCFAFYLSSFCTFLINRMSCHCCSS
jgi:hypothetical protein